MKVLVFTNIYPNRSHPYFGVFVKNQVQSLIDSSPSDEFSTLVIKTKKAGGSHYNYLSAFFKLAYIRFFSSFDVIHCHHAFCVFMAKFLFFKNIVYTNHEGEYFKGGVVESIKRRAISLSDKVIFVNVDMQKQNRELCKSAPYLLPCAVERRYFLNNKSKSECREVLGLGSNDLIIFFPANPSRNEKNYNLLVESLSLWDESLHGKKPTVVCGGTIEYKDIWIWYTACDVVVSCSKYESDGMIYKEAIICDAFFISTDVGNAKLYSQDGLYGIILDGHAPTLLYGALIDFFSDTSTKKNVTSNAKNNGLESIDEQATRLLNIFRGLDNQY